MPRGGYIRFATYPRTEVPPPFVKDLVGIFRSHEATISTVALPKGLTSDQVLSVVSGDLAQIGFTVRPESPQRSGSRDLYFSERTALRN